jgi:AmiR/NasT family two-component response regulator
MDPIVRVVVATRPRLMREMVLSMLSEQAGIDVVGEADDEQQVPSLVAATRPDFLLIAADESKKRPALCDTLLKEFPALTIIAVAATTNVSVCYWASLDIHSKTMEASGEALLAMMQRREARGQGGAA